MIHFCKGFAVELEKFVVKLLNSYLFFDLDCFIVVKKIPVAACGGETKYRFVKSKKFVTGLLTTFFFRVETICKKEVPFVYRPIIPNSGIIPKNEIKKFIITKCKFTKFLLFFS